MENKVILNIENLNKYFKTRGVLKHALNDVNFQVNEGDFYGIIGESGSGKTTLGKSIIRLNNISGGNVYFFDRNISSIKISKEKKQWLVNNMQMIFQDPLSSLNPNMNVIKIISEPLEISKEIINQVKDVIDNKVVFNSYYKYDFLLKTKKNVIENSLKFYEEYNSILEKVKKENQKLNFSDKESWVSSYNDVEKIYDDILLNQKKLVKYIDNIVDYNSTILQNMLVKLENKELDQDFMNFYNLKNSEKKILKPIQKSVDLYEKEKNDLKTYKEEWSIRSKKKLLSDNIRDIKYRIKFNSTNAILAKSKIDNVRFLLFSHHAKIQKEIINEGFKFKFINESDFLDQIKPLMNYLEKLYGKANSELNAINSKNSYTSTIKLVKENFSFNKIESKIKNIFDLKIIKKIIVLNNKEKIAYENGLKNLVNNFHKAKDNLNKIKEKYILESEKNETKNSSSNKNIITKTIIASNKFKIKYKRFIISFYKVKKEQIKNLKIVNLKLKNEIYKTVEKHLKKLNDLRPSSIENFNLKEKIILLNNNKKTFKNQLKVKKSAMLTIDWEFKNAIFNTELYEDLFSESRYVLQLHKNDLVKLLTLERVYQSLDNVGLKREHAYRYPHEFSGGQRQRLVIARALINTPKLIIADEAISALDVSVQAQVINIMKNLSKKQGMTFLFIAHDLSMVKNICNKVIIMHNGRIVEKGSVEKIFNNPTHPYTISLFKAIPEINKMHIDLAMFNVNHNYDKYYDASNVPKFFQIDSNHEVLATKDQFNKWTK